MKELIEKILAALKHVDGLELTDERVKEIRDELGSLSLTGTGLQQVGDDRTVIKTADYEDMRKNLRELRKERSDLQDQLSRAESGDSDDRRKLEKAETQLKELKPLVEQLTAMVDSEWARVSALIPDGDESKELRGKFKFDDAEKGDEGKIGLLDKLANLEKAREYDSLGLIDVFMKADGGGEDGGEGGDGDPAPEVKPGTGITPRHKSKKGGAKLNPDDPNDADQIITQFMTTPPANTPPGNVR